MTARAWVPLLKALRQAGWDRKEVSDGFSAIEYVWRRGGPANLQQITFNITGAQVFVGDESHTTSVMNVARAWRVLWDIGAFAPAPERLDWRRAAA